MFGDLSVTNGRATQTDRAESLGPWFCSTCFRFGGCLQEWNGASAAAAEWHAETSEARAAVVAESCPLRHYL